MIFDFDFKSLCVDDFDFDFKIILQLIYDFKTSKSSIKSSNLASCITSALAKVLPDNPNEVSQAFVEAVTRMNRASTTVAEVQAGS